MGVRGEHMKSVTRERIESLKQHNQDLVDECIARKDPFKMLDVYQEYVDICTLALKATQERERADILVKALERIEYEDSYGGVNQYPSASVRARQALAEYKGDE
jgi:hypothetical protein